MFHNYFPGNRLLIFKTYFFQNFYFFYFCLFIIKYYFNNIFLIWTLSCKDFDTYIILIFLRCTGLFSWIFWRRPVSLQLFLAVYWTPDVNFIFDQILYRSPDNNLLRCPGHCKQGHLFVQFTAGHFCRRTGHQTAALVL